MNSFMEDPVGDPASNFYKVGAGANMTDTRNDLLTFRMITESTPKWLLRGLFHWCQRDNENIKF